MPLSLPPSRLGALLAPFSPKRFPYLRFAMTLALGIASGFLFQWLNIPLPWMLGPMSACTLAVLLDAPLAAPAAVRPAMVSVVGIMLGSRVSADVIARIPQWSLTIAIMFAFLVIAAVIGVSWYRLVGKMDRVTAFYAGMPGGLVEMSTIGEARGGDGAMISLVHSARILIIVASVPIIVQFIEGVHLGPRQASSLSVMDAPVSVYFWLIGTGVLGSLLGRWLRLPAGHLFGPMILSAAVHVAGLTDFVLPLEIVAAAQIMIGCITGCRFMGWDKRVILRVLALCVGSTGLILMATLACATLTAKLLGTKVAPMLLALAPAGIAEMSLVAIALHLDAAFVMVHQMLRIWLTSFTAAIVFRLIGWGKGAESDPAP